MQRVAAVTAIFGLSRLAGYGLEVMGRSVLRERCLAFARRGNLGSAVALKQAVAEDRLTASLVESVVSKITGLDYRIFYVHVLLPEEGRGTGLHRYAVDVLKVGMPTNVTLSSAMDPSSEEAWSEPATLVRNDGVIPTTQIPVVRVFRSGQLTLLFDVDTDACESFCFIVAAQVAALCA